MSFVCALMGQGPQLIASAELLLARSHRIYLVVSDCPQVTAWTQKRGISRVGAHESHAESLSREPFDYLFSIVNHAITSAEVLALPRLGAINYHDSRLPAYGGFNATSWAILDGQREHGITWHRMTANVDAGAILVQKTFPISEEDTAFSLAARASEVAVRSFGELLEALENGSVAELPASPARDFHFKSERPGFAVIDPRGSVVEVERLVRALDFGKEESWLTRAKLLTPSGAFIAVGSVASASSSGAPGTIQRVNVSELEVILGDGSLVLSDLSTLEGTPLAAEQLGALGLVAGGSLPSPSVELAEAARTLDQVVTKSERSWVSRLSRIDAPTLTELRAHASGGSIERTSCALPAAYLSRSREDRHTLGATVVSAYLARVGEDVARVSLGLVSDLPASLAPLYASVVPLSLEVSVELSLADATNRVAAELASASERKSYARDVWTRYPRLRAREGNERELPIVVSFSESAPQELPEGARLLVHLPEGGSDLTLVWDSAALSRVHAERLAERFVHLAGVIAGAELSTRIESLSIVTPNETRLLLETFQDTSRPAATIACIHRLFEEQVERTPDKTALVFRDESLTYRELDARANVLARELQSRGVGPDALVAISIERSLDMVVGLLAILKAGGAYVPLDPAYPVERLSIMLEDSGARLLLTQSHLEKRLPSHGAQILLVDEARSGVTSEGAPASDVRPEHLAYVIFTSGSTGRPKGVMVEHRNAANFFAGMDERVGTKPGVWLAVTSISFDISVLELFWTLTRGFEVVIQEEGDRASLLQSQSRVRASDKPMDFGLFYFAADSSAAPAGNAYRLLLEGARFADTHDFTAVWTPERHFHAFGGLYPNPAVTSAAVAAVTSRVALRAGSVVIPLHDPIRVAEEWAVVDNLSNGRVGLSFASGWHANDFALKPENFERRREVMLESIDTVLKLWAGEKIRVKNGSGQEIEVGVLPRPVNERPPMWIASAGSVDTFKAAGRLGYNVLTNMLGQDIKDLTGKFAAYREARREAGHEGDGIVSVMLHTFVTSSDEKAKQLARGPFGNYLKSSYDLVKVAPWMFPAFKQPSLANADGASAFDPSRFDEGDMAALLDHAFDRYFDTAGLFGTPERALALVEQLKEIGATEVACLIDFGIDPDVVLENLVYLDELRRLANPGLATADLASPHSGVTRIDTAAPVTIREQFERRAITHFQCTPSMARMIVADGTIGTMQSLEKLLVGGEALPADLADKLRAELPKTTLLNMYGPTETTVWSTTAQVTGQEAITIGTPIANTQIRILDKKLALAPLGTPGELCIGGWGVVRGYLGKPELTAERFVADPYLARNRLYRTGDLARFRDDGQLEYIGRIDQQVKVNGYRIELGEIETILGRHAAVKEAVVAVKEGAVGPELVGYVIANGETSKDAGTPDVSAWQKRWDEAYSKRAGASDAPVRFDTSGWLDSYTGTPIPSDQMREWLDQTVERILAQKPRRVLEIGCGTGMILYSLLPHVEHYTAVDLSPHALETIRQELSADERAKVTLLNKGAHELDAIANGSVDLVIINSVAQYFPNADYLTSVLERASQILVDGGKIFLGDVRSFEEARNFHALVELEKAPGQSTRETLKARIAERVELDTELLLGVPFFASLESRVPRLRLGSMQLKRGTFANEMRDFRSDVVLEAGASASTLAASDIRVLPAPDSLSLVRELLADKPALVLLQGVKNARLSHAVEVLERLERDGVKLTAEELRAAIGSSRGIDPNELFTLEGYDVELRFGEKPGTFDALFRNRATAPSGAWAARSSSGPVTSTPRATLGADTLVPKLKAHLKDFLPEYMVPQSFVLMTAFPLTPNGKIDRKALPKPVEQARRTTTEYAVPSNDLERTIAEIWRELLGVERVGRKDNFFDLGASSLLTVEANNRLQNLLGKKIPLVTMFRFPTIESLASHLGKTLDPKPSADGAPGAEAAGGQERQARLDAAAERRRRARSQAN